MTLPSYSNKLIGASLVLALVCCSSLYTHHEWYSEAEDITPLQSEQTTQKRVTLEQAWDEDTREGFWYTSQGSQIIPYSWFTWLEVADSKDLFRSNEHMSYLGYLPMESSKMNPSGLPIGLL